MSQTRAFDGSMRGRRRKLSQQSSVGGELQYSRIAMTLEVVRVVKALTMNFSLSQNNAATNELCSRFRGDTIAQFVARRKDFLKQSSIGLKFKFVESRS